MHGNIIFWPVLRDFIYETCTSQKGMQSQIKCLMGKQLGAFAIFEIYFVAINANVYPY